MKSQEINAKQADAFAPLPDGKFLARLTHIVFVMTTLSLTIGNFVYQYLRPWLDQSTPDWRQAIERSWFQWIAAIVIWLVLQINLRIFSSSGNSMPQWRRQKGKVTPQ